MTKNPRQEPRRAGQLRREPRAGRCPGGPLADAFLAIAARPGLEAKVEETARQARVLIGAHRSVVSVTRGESEGGAVGARSLSATYAAHPDRASMPDLSLCAEVCRTGRTMRLTRAELETHPGLGGDADRTGEAMPLRGWLAAPLVGRDGASLGLLWLSDRKRGDFRETDEVLLGQLARFAALELERALDERALQESRRQFREIAANYPGVIFRRVLHPDGLLSYAYMSEGSNTLLNASPGDFRKPRPPEEHARRFVPEDRGIWLAALRRSATELCPFDLEARVAGNDGSVRWVHAVAHPRREADGSVVWNGMSHDITDRKQAEAERERLLTELKVSEQRLRDITNAVPGFIVQFDAAMRYRFVNTVAADWYALAPEQVLGRTLREIIGEARFAFVEPYYRRVLRQGEAVSFENFIDRPGAVRRDMLVTLVPDRDVGGTVRGCYALAVDITERKRVEQALRESEQRFRDIAESSSDWIWETDGEHRFTYVSARIAEVSGRPHQEFLGKAVDEVMVGKVTGDRIAEHLADLHARQPFRNFVYWIDRPIGRRCCSVSGTPRFDAEGRFLGFRGVGSDITERQLAEERQYLLMAELDHRVKNTLATVQSIAAHSLPESEHIETLRGRLAALAHAHSVLAESRWEGARLKGLIEGELAPYESDKRERIAIRGEDVLLVSRAAQTLVLVLHELTTNAAKYGSLSVPGGGVEIAWNVNTDRHGTRLVLHWVERGGPPVTPPSRRGFGLTMIEDSLSYQLDGEVRLEFPPEGVRCEMAIPLPDRAAR